MEQQEQSIYQALADPTRRKILSLLSEKDLLAGEIAQQFEVSWPSVSRHLGVLRGAGLITFSREGQNVVYSLDRSVLEQVRDAVATMAGHGRDPRGDDSRYELFERFNEQTRRAIGYAQEEARDMAHPEVAPEHLLLGLMGVEDGVAARALEAAGLRAEDVRIQVSALRPRDESARDTLSFSADSRRVLEHALRQAIRLGHSYVGTGPLLLAIVALGAFTGGVAAVFGSHQVDPGRIRRDVEDRMRGWAEAAPPRSGGLFDRFTVRARDVVVQAQESARALGHNYIGTEHLLLGLLEQSSGPVARAFASVSMTAEAAREAIVAAVGPGKDRPAGHIPFTPRGKKVLELTAAQAMSLGHRHIGAEHVLLALIEEGDGLAVQILAAHCGGDLGALRRALFESVLAGPPLPEDAPADRPVAPSPDMGSRLESLERTVREELAEVKAAMAAIIQRLPHRDEGTAPDAG